MGVGELEHTHENMQYDPVPQATDLNNTGLVKQSVPVATILFS